MTQDAIRRGQELAKSWKPQREMPLDERQKRP